MSDLEGKVVAISGAARGMGKAHAKGFLEAGAKVVAMDQSWEPTGFSGDADDSWRRELEARSDDVVIATVDIAQEAQVKAAYDAAMDKFGTVDALLNNAGMRQRDLFPPDGRITTLETDNSDWHKMFDVTVFGTLTMVRYFIQPMLEKQRGSIMSVISSGALHSSSGGAYMALRPNSREMPYQSAKAALLTMMFYLGDEVRGQNVAVNVLIPGHARTTGFDEQNAARRLRGTGETGRAPAALRADHIVPLAMFLADQDAKSGVTGKCFDTMTWNIEHGLGGADAWVDLEAEAGIEVAIAAAQAK
jgi:NAD(P)-dependent dehydrogenase (short-subunit alcohol dehydrogenase family)